MHRAYTATMKHGQDYEPDYGPRYEQHYDPHYILSYAAMHAGPTTATAPPRCWTGGRTTLDTYEWSEAPMLLGIG